MNFNSTQTLHPISRKLHNADIYKGGKDMFAAKLVGIVQQIYDLWAIQEPCFCGLLKAHQFNLLSYACPPEKDQSYCIHGTRVHHFLHGILDTLLAQGPC